MITLGPLNVSGLVSVRFPLYPYAPTDPFNLADISNESGVTLTVKIGPASYSLPPQSTVRYQLAGTETFIDVVPQTAPTVTGSVGGTAYNKSDTPPLQIARGSNFLGGTVGLPADRIPVATLTTVLLGVIVGANANDSFQILGSGELAWSDGTAAAPDVALYHSGAKTLTVDDGAGGAATLNVVGRILASTTLDITGVATVGALNSTTTVAATTQVSGATLAITGTADVGTLRGIATLHNLGTAARGANGAYVQLGDAGDANNVYFTAQGVGAGSTNIGIILRPLGSGTFQIQTAAGAQVVAVTLDAAGAMGISLRITDTAAAVRGADVAQLYLKGPTGGATAYSGIRFAMWDHSSGWGADIQGFDDTGLYGGALRFRTGAGSAVNIPTEKMRITSSGHLQLSGTAPTITALSGDFAGSAVAGNDVDGVVTLTATGGPVALVAGTTLCRVNFATAYVTTPVVIVQPNGAAGTNTFRSCVVPNNITTAGFDIMVDNTAAAWTPDASVAHKFGYHVFA